MIVYISIGNSDDKLTQREWSRYCADLQTLLMRLAGVFHGVWYSESGGPWQNMCVCLEVGQPHLVDEVQQSLAGLAGRYRQDSIAWAEAPQTTLLRPKEEQR